MADIDIDKETQTKKQIAHSRRFLFFLRVSCFLLLLLLPVSVIFANYILAGILLILLSYKLYATAVFAKYLRQLKLSGDEQAPSEQRPGYEMVLPQTEPPPEVEGLLQPSFSRSDFAVLFFENEMRRISSESLPSYVEALGTISGLDNARKPFLGEDSDKDDPPPPTYEDVITTSTTV